MALTTCNLPKCNGIYLHELLLINTPIIIMLLIYIINVKLTTNVNKIVIK